MLKPRRAATGETRAAASNVPKQQGEHSGHGRQEEGSEKAVPVEWQVFDDGVHRILRLGVGDWSEKRERRLPEPQRADPGNRPALTSSGRWQGGPERS